MDRLYVMPIIGAGASREDMRRPKYATDFAAYTWGSMPFGNEDQCLVMVKGIGTVLHDTLTAYSDILAVPEDLDTNPTAGAVTVTQNFLETLNVPAEWITTSLTWRQILRVVIGVFQLNQRFGSISSGKSIFADGVDLSRTFASLNATTKGQLVATGESLALDVSEITPANTLRTILRVLAVNFSNRKLFIAGVQI